MNKFVLSAIALTTAGGLASAGTGSEEWLTLDREIASLASAQAAATAPTSAVTVSGFIRSSYQNSSDVSISNSGPDGSNDLGGFAMENARVQIDGTVGDYNLRIQMDAGSGGGLLSTLATGEPGSLSSFEVLDAYGAWNISEQFRLSMGQFRSPFLASSQLEEDQLLFLDRSVLGELWSSRDQGVMLSGQYDMLGWWIAALNGQDDTGDDLSFSGRVAFDMMGKPAGKVEGAYGASGNTDLGVSAGYYMDDDSVYEDLAAWNVAATLVMGPFSAAAEYVDHDDGFAEILNAYLGGPVYAEGPAIYSVSAGFMFVPDRWEVAGRYQDLDDDSDTTVIDVGLNYYGMGHNAKWQAGYTMVDSDSDDADADILGIGLTVSI